MVAGGVSLYRDQVKSGIENYLLELQRILRYGFTAEEISKYREEYMAAIKRGAKEEKARPKPI